MAGSSMAIGTSGLLAAQRQLATASHNISNVNTEGFSRQRSEQSSRMPQFSGNGFIGTGVSVETTVRLANEFLEEQIRTSNSQYGKYDAFYGMSKQIEDILANPDYGLTPTMESFFSALQEANDNPSSTPARQVLLTEANTMTERFRLLDDRFIQLNNQVNQELKDITLEVSDAARSLAQLNVDIVQRIGAGQGDMPNDLMDQREVLIKQIAEKIDVKVIYQSDGAANLFIGSGQALVIGGSASMITTDINKFNAEDLDIFLIQGAGKANITSEITGGELQGTLDFKEKVLEPSRRGLGRVAIAMTEEINQQHRLGMTIQGTSAPYPLGQDFFTDLGGPIAGLPGQSSATTATMTITDSRLLSTSDYSLVRVDSNVPPYTLTRLNDGKTFSGASIAALSTTVEATEGFSLSSDIADGESFLMRPTFTASADMGVQVNNVLDIALASPMVSGAFTNADGSAANSGIGKISLPTNSSVNNIPITDGTLPPLAANLVDVVLTYDNTAKEFNISTTPAASPAMPVGPIAFDNTNPAHIGGLVVQLPAPYNDIQFTLSGVPDDTDRFVIQNNTTPFDDNRNGILMAQLQTAKTIENSSTDFQSAYAIIVSDVGTKTHSSEIDLLAQQTLSEQAKATRESYSGVNLDEEAADLLKYQQAYQAAARVISTADQMFQTLINAV